MLVGFMLRLMGVFNLSLIHQLHYGYAPLFRVLPGTIMSNADDFKDKPVRVSRLPPSHTTRTSVFPYTLMLGTFAQDVSPP